jgi:protein O-mannosyl-transferase
MATKKKYRKAVHGTSAVERPEKYVRTSSGQKPISVPKWFIPAVLTITTIAFIQVLGAGFVNLDDSDYVTNNPLIRTGSLLQVITTPVQGNYHPLTMLSLYINHLISGEQAWSYHLFNLLFHLVNCILVFRLVLLLTGRNVIIALTTAVLFGIHPMHVESVAWVAERKDVLYGLFFLAGLISYTKYVDSNSKKEYVLSILFLILSLLSKPAAVIFPLALGCIDLLRRRQLSIRLVVEKVPFFILAAIIGILTMIAQRKAGAVGNLNFSVATKVLFGFYGIMMYFIKMVIPFNLVVFYPYPAINKALPVEYYIGPLFFIALAGVFFYMLKRNRIVPFGILFYLTNLLLVLQVLPVGGAIIAERYTYIPYIGLFVIVGWLIDRFAKGNRSKAYTTIFIANIFFSLLTWSQVAVWKNSAVLWDHAIKVRPSNKAYANRATELRNEKNYNLALEYFNEALSLSIIDYESFNNRGNIYFDLKQPDLAIKDYRKALSIKADYYPSLDNLGVQYATLGQYDSALKYENQALLVKPDYKVAYSNRALIYMKVNRFQDAIADWGRFLQYEPGAADVYNTIGFCYQSMNRFEESLTSINKAIEIDPQGVFYLNRAYTLRAMNNLGSAKSDVLTARQAGINIPADLANSLGIK